MSSCWSIHMFMVVWTHSAFASGWLGLSLGSVAMDMNDNNWSPGCSIAWSLDHYWKTSMDLISMNSFTTEVLLRTEILCALVFNEKKIYNYFFLQPCRWVLDSTLTSGTFLSLAMLHKFRLCIICPCTSTIKPYVDNNQCTKNPY